MLVDEAIRETLRADDVVIDPVGMEAFYCYILAPSPVLMLAALASTEPAVKNCLFLKDVGLNWGFLQASLL